MASRLLDKASAEERLVFFSLAFSYPIYFLGGLYVVGSVVGWLIFAIFLLRIYLKLSDTNPTQLIAKVSPIAWLWVMGMSIMLLSLLIAHVSRDHGFGLTIKSSIGWAKGWALLALFILLGCTANIRLKIISRACCIASASAIPFTLIALIIYFAGGSGEIYVSPLKAIGGPLETFQVGLFGINPETGFIRMHYFAPWAPAAGLMSCFYLVLCLTEKNKALKVLGVSGAAIMCLLCQSRAGLGLFFFIVPAMYGLSLLRNPLIWVLCGVGFPLLFIFGEPVYQLFQDSYTQVKESRPGSTRVRASLAQIAVQRWQDEAPIWGHGVVERGPKTVERMPIGTHHSWYGLLFVKGIVGLFALAVPLIFTSIYLLITAQRCANARTALGLCIILVAYSFFENLEILSYLYWPALLWVGASLCPGNCSTQFEPTNTVKE